MAVSAKALQKDSEITDVVQRFHKLCIQHSENTRNVRIYKGPWGSDIYNVPEKIRNKIGSIISFLQENKLLFCQENKILMLYNIQNVTNNSYFFLLQLRILSEEEATDLSTFDKGTPLQLTLDDDGNIGDENYAFDFMEYCDDLENTEEDPPVTYDNIDNYSDPKPCTPAVFPLHTYALTTALVGSDLQHSFAEKLIALQSVLMDSTKQSKSQMVAEDLMALKSTEVTSPDPDIDPIISPVTYSYNTAYNTAILDEAWEQFGVPTEMPSPVTPFRHQKGLGPPRYVAIDCHG